MAFWNWVIIGALAIIVKNRITDTAENDEEFQKIKTESSRRYNIDTERKNTPCKFKDGITYEDFSELAHKVGRRIKRITEVNIFGAVIYCTVESQTGYSEWGFSVDFNDWGHVTGTYWEHTDNYDSKIPEHFGNMMSGEIHQMLCERSIILPEFSDYINNDEDLGTPLGLSYFQKVGFFKRIFSKEQQIAINVNSQNFHGEHIYLVISMLKSNGFKNINSVPVKDVGQNSNKYLFEVEQVNINGASVFEIGDTFAESSEIVITYHAKQEIPVPYAMDFFKKKNYIKVRNQLRDMGFSNIQVEKIEDLVTGWVIKNGSVEQVLVRMNGEEVPVDKDRSYDFDTEIVITYHTFSK